MYVCMHRDVYVVCMNAINAYVYAFMYDCQTHSAFVNVCMDVGVYVCRSVCMC